MQLPAIADGWPALLALPDEYDGGEEAELARQELLAGAPPAPPRTLVEAARLSLAAPSLEVALALLEAWSPAEEAKHPRWPKGTPGGLGGHFMKTGQRFSVGGVEYDVAFTAPGGVYAHVATKGATAKAQLVWIPAAGKDEQGRAVIKGVGRPPVDVSGYANAAHYETAQIKATVIDPYVQPDHDASIPRPPEAPPGLTEARWQRFGRADQLRYVDLMHQLGPWSDSKAQTLVNAELAKKPSDLVSFVKGAYSSQFGSSSGFTIGLLQTFSKWFQSGHKPSQAELEKDRGKYEATKQVQDAAARVIQWDLYNRVKAPDIAVFHKSGDNKSWWQSNILNGSKPVFSGLSQTQRYTVGGFGSVAVASPVAIRNIVMATTSADIYTGHGFGGEQEVSIGEPMRLKPDRSFVFNDSELSGPQQEWLRHQTQNGSDGSILEVLRANVEQGIPLPSLPEPANLVMDSAGGKQWVDPPQAAKVGIGKLGYAEVDADGVPVAHPAKDLALKPGDYIEGMKGTRYIVVADPGSSFGIRYVKVTDQGAAKGPMKPYAGEIHDQATGHQAYGGHQDFHDDESYEFTITLPFKKLAGHYDLPTAKAESGLLFVPGAWAQSGDKKPVSQLGEGGKFFLDGVPFEVQHVVSAKQVKVKSLSSGQLGTVNGAYATNYLKLKEGYTEQGVPAFDPSAFFVHPNGELAAMGLETGDLFYAGTSDVAWRVESVDEAAGAYQAVQVAGPDPGKKLLFHPTQHGSRLEPKPPGWQPPQVGDTLPWGGKKATVTKLLKGGNVQLNLAPGVVKVKPDDPALAFLFSGENHELGAKLKVKDMTPGQKFHGGTGGKVRPYLLLALGQKQEGKAGLFARVKNLDTGEVSLVGHQKAFKLLVPTQGVAAAAPGGADLASQAEVFNPAAWKPGAATTFSQLKVGDKFLGVDGHTPLEVTADKGAAWEVKNLMTGATSPSLKHEVATSLLVPSNVMPAVAFDPDAYVPGGTKKLADLKVGDIFVGATNGKHYLVTKTGAKSGLTAVDLTTGKSSSPWKYDKSAETVKPKADAPASKAHLTAGDPAKLGQLLEGEQFTLGGVLHEVVAAADGKEGNATVAQVLPDGTLGFPGKVGYYPSLWVTFHANVADKAKPAAPVSGLDLGHVATVISTQGTLEHLATAPYSAKSKTGGGYFFAQAKNAGVGTVLLDKEGKLLLVKAAGADPIVSDGSKHWLIDGEGNYKLGQEPFDDHAPPLELGVPPMQPAGAQTLAQLGVKEGDWVLVGGMAQKITAASPGQPYFTEMGAGGTNMLGWEIVPDGYAKHVGGEWEFGGSSAPLVGFVVGDPLAQTSPNFSGEVLAGLKGLGASVDKTKVGVSWWELTPGDLVKSSTGPQTSMWQITGGPYLGPNGQQVVPARLVWNHPGATSPQAVGTESTLEQGAFQAGNFDLVGHLAQAPDAQAGGLTPELAAAVQKVLDSWEGTVATPGPVASAGQLIPGDLLQAGTGSVWMITAHPNPVVLGAQDTVPAMLVKHPEAFAPGSLKPLGSIENLSGYVIGSGTFKWLGVVPAEAQPGAATTEAVPAPPAPKSALAAAIQASLNDQWADNSFVKVTTGMLKPGQLYKSGNGNTWVWHGALSSMPSGYAELVSDETGANVVPHGGLAAIPLNYVPAQVGPVVDFHDDAWENSGKALMTDLEPGDVFAFNEGIPLKVVAKGPMSLTVVKSVPSSLAGQSEPYMIDVTPATQVWRVVPSAPAAPATVHVDSDLLGEPVTWNGQKAWVKFVSTKADGSAQFGLGSTPGSSGASDIATVPVGEVTAGHAADAAPAPVAAPHPLDGFSSWKDGVKIGDLAVGDQFAEGSGDSYFIGEITAQPTAGKVLYRVVSAGPKTTFAVGDVGSVGVAHTPDWYKHAPATAPTLSGEKEALEALAAAIKGGDPQDYFTAESELRELVAGEIGIEPFDVTEEQFDEWVASKSIEHGVEIPAGPDYEAGDYGGPAAPAFEPDSSTEKLTVGTEFETADGDKMVVTMAGPGWTMAEPIGMEGEGVGVTWATSQAHALLGLPPHGSLAHEPVHVLSPGPEGPPEPGPHGFAKGDHVSVDGVKHTVYEDTPGGVIVVGPDDEMTMVPPQDVDLYDPNAAPAPTLTPNDGRTFLELGLGKGDKIESYKGGTETVTKVYGVPGTEGHVYDTVNDQTGEKATYGTGGVPSAYQKLSVPPADAKMMFASGLQVGDVFWHDGQEFVVKKVNPGAAGQVGVVPVSGNGMTSWFDKGEVVHKSPQDAGVFKPPSIPAIADAVKKANAAAAGATAAVSKLGDALKASPLVPYSPKSKTGGGYHFKNLGQLNYGDIFEDKTGTRYVAGVTYGDEKEFWTQAAGDNPGPFRHDVAARVKVVV